MPDSIGHARENGQFLRENAIAWQTPNIQWRGRCSVCVNLDG